jgi:hypothetical protein
MGIFGKIRSPFLIADGSNPLIDFFDRGKGLIQRTGHIADWPLIVGDGTR